MKSAACSASLWFATLLVAVTATAEPVSVRSPDGRTTVTVDVDKNGAPRYAVARNGVELMPAGFLGMRFQSQPAFDDGFRVADPSTSSHDETWEQPWGERRYVRDHHNELLVKFDSVNGAARQFSVRLRVFDDGFGFRYEVPEQPGYEAVNITDELTEFRLDDTKKQIKAWWIPGRRWNRYEYLYHSTPLADVPMAHTPMPVRLPDRPHLSVPHAAPGD